MVTEIGLFGATAVDPLVGGLVGSHDSWRLLWWILAAVSLLELTEDLVVHDMHTRCGLRSGRAVPLPHNAHTTILVIAATVGFGAGATVSPGLFLAALSCPSDQLGPALAQGSGRAALDHGVSVGGWRVLVLVVGDLAACILLWRGGGPTHSRQASRRGWAVGRRPPTPRRSCPRSDERSPMSAVRQVVSDEGTAPPVAAADVLQQDIEWEAP